MGKDLRGREMGEGIMQRKDGRYSARITSRRGRRVEKLCRKADIKPFSMHALRHTFATRCVERGVNPKSLQKILGHAQLSTTMDTYVHVTDDSLQVAMMQFQGV